MTTPRGVRLSATFEPAPREPAHLGPAAPHEGTSAAARGWTAPSGTAVVFAHGFLADRSSRGRADVFAAAYRSLGLATMQFDFSGCGASDDDVVEVAREVEDLTAVCADVVARGYPRLVVHGHSLGALVALRTSVPAVELMVLTGAVTGPILHPWDQVLSAVQLSELRDSGRTTVLDDGPSGRTDMVISRQTLVDFSDVDQPSLLGEVTCPVLMVHGGGLVDGEEHPLLTRSRVGLPFLPAGSALEVVSGADHSLLDYTDSVVRRVTTWLAAHLT